MEAKLSKSKEKVKAFMIAELADMLNKLTLNHRRNFFATYKVYGDDLTKVPYEKLLMMMELAERTLNDYAKKKKANLPTDEVLIKLYNALNEEDQEMFDSQLDDVYDLADIQRKEALTLLTQLAKNHLKKNGGILLL